MPRSLDPLNALLENGSRDFRLKNADKASGQRPHHGISGGPGRRSPAIQASDDRKRNGVTPAPEDRILPSFLQCDHTECAEQPLCVRPGHWEATIPLSWGKQSTNALLSADARVRYKASRPIRQLARQMAQELAMVRIGVVWFEFTPLVTGRTAVDFDACDLWSKHFVDGLGTSWNPPRGSKGHDPSFLPDELTTAGVIPNDSEQYAWGKAVYRAERAKMNAIRVGVFANHAHGCGCRSCKEALLAASPQGQQLH